MANIQKRDRKNGPVFLVDVRIHGFPRQKKTFRRLTDAKLWAQQTEAAIRQGEFRNVLQSAKRKTVQEVIDRYRAEVLPHKSANTQRIEKTILGYWQAALGEYALSYVDAELVSKKLDELAKAGDARRKPGEDDDKPKKPPAPKSRKTMKHYRDTLALLFKHARAWNWTASNPLDGVNKITKIRNERTRYLKDKERDALLKACKASSSKYLYLIVLMALSTGARKNELLSLNLDDVDTARGRAILRDTKNGDTRPIPITPALRPMLAKQIKASQKLYAGLQHKPRQLWLFPREDGAEPLDIRKAWETAVDEAGVRDFRFHDLRHSAASYLAMNGASPLEIAEVLGHRTLQMVRRYSHLSESHVTDLVERVSAKVLPASL
jgi:integrase